MIEKLFLTLIEITLSTSLIILPLLLLSSTLKKRYTAKWRYVIWLIIAIRLVIPINLTFPEALFDISVPVSIESSSNNSLSQVTTDKNFIANTEPELSDSDTSNIKDTSSTLTNTTLGKEETTSTISISTQMKNFFNYINLSPLKIITLIWLLGVFISIAYQLVGYFTFRKNALRWSRPVTNTTILNILHELCNDLNISKPINLMTCKKVSTPMVLGLFNPIVLLPKKTMDADDLSVILKHELIHLKRHDITYKLFINIAYSLHWFNPIIYLMVKEANKDLEFYCDEKVIENMDKSYRAKYSEAILSVMDCKQNYNAILSTNFNGGVDTMKKRFKNIFDTTKKRRGIVSLCLMLSLVIISSSLVACQNSNNSTPKDTAEGFLKGYYEVNNILLLDELNAIIDEDPLEITSSTENGTIATLTEEGDVKYRDTSLRNISSYITPTFGDTLLTNRLILRNLTRASEYGYTLKLTDIQLSTIGTDTSTRKSYTYSLQTKLTYADGTSVTQTVEGNISLLKEDDKWLVNGFDEITGVMPDKKYYKDKAVAIEVPTSNTSAVDTVDESTTSDDLCNSYIEALKNSDFNFIASHTVNALHSTTLEEGQKTWDTIKISSVKIINSDERENANVPGVFKAYYELELDVTEPGTSDFPKGKTIRWLYLSASTKNNTLHWVVEDLSLDGPPSEEWFDIINGG